MDKAWIVQILRSNWHLLGIMLFLFGLGGWFGITRDEEVEAVVVEHTETAVLLTSPEFAMESRWSVPLKDQETANAIAAYEEKLKIDRDSEDTPVTMFRLANLYFSRTHEYDKAAKFYETLIQDYPASPFIDASFRNLLVCYERSGEQSLYLSMLRRIMEHFEPGSEEFIAAARALGI